MDVELIWAAGFFDGEGTISVRTGKRSKTQTVMNLKVRQNDRRPLDRFQQAVGCGKVYGPYERKAGDLSSNPYHVWELNKQQEIFDVIDALIPFLSEPKREQIWNNLVKLQVLREEHNITGRI
jgi:hypothetical protein